MTINDVARAAGCRWRPSQGHQRTLRRRPGTAARVLDTVKELGFESSLVARSLRSRRTNVIGILVAEFEPFSSELLKGISQAARGRGTSSSPTPSRAPTTARRLGTALPVPAVRDADRRRADRHPDGGHLRRRHPGRRDRPAHGPDRSGDDRRRQLRRGAHRDLVPARPGSHPHRLPGRAPRPGVGPAARERLPRGPFRGRIAIDPDLIRVAGYSPDLADAPAHALLQLPDRPTAIFAANDSSALRTIEVAEALGLRVPDDLSVIGFDDIPEAAKSTPR
ncbi:LacI family DNA-binding transcriptional regulator [Oerskovia sp. M15]